MKEEARALDLRSVPSTLYFDYITHDISDKQKRELYHQARDYIGVWWIKIKVHLKSGGEFTLKRIIQGRVSLLPTWKIAGASQGDSVEAIFASAVGLDPLRKIVRLINSCGHEVQLHVHTEWLNQLPKNIWQGKTGYNIREFSEEDQTELIALGLRNLYDSGAPKITAFRAGNYGANLDTLRALANNKLLFDSSYNCCYLHGDFHIPSHHPPDKFRTATFNEINTCDILSSEQFKVINSNSFRTARRIAQQGARRILSKVLR